MTGLRILLKTWVNWGKRERWRNLHLVLPNCSALFRCVDDSTAAVHKIVRSSGLCEWIRKKYFSQTGTKEAVVWEGLSERQCGNYSLKYSTDGATTLSRMNLSGYVRHVTIFSWIFAIACCLIVGLELGLGLGLVSGWLVVMHTYLYYFRLSFSHCRQRTAHFIGAECWPACSNLSGKLWEGLIRVTGNSAEGWFFGPYCTHFSLYRIRT